MELKKIHKNEKFVDGLRLIFQEVPEERQVAKKRNFV